MRNSRRGYGLLNGLGPGRLGSERVEVDPALQGVGRGVGGDVGHAILIGGGGELLAFAKVFDLGMFNEADMDYGRSMLMGRGLWVQCQVIAGLVAFGEDA